MSVSELTASKKTASYLNASKMSVFDLNASKMSVSDLNATKIVKCKHPMKANSCKKITQHSYCKFSCQKGQN